MVKATYSITIQRPLQDVFDLVSDPARDPEWNRNAIAVRKLSAGPATRGARYQGTYKGFGECELEVVDYDPPHVATIAGTNKQGNFSYSYMIEPAGDGAMLREETQFSPRGILKIMAPMMRVMLARRVKELGEAARQHLETGPPASRPGG